MGYAYAHKLYGRAAYQWSVETSIYVDRQAKRQGIGRRLHESLEAALKQQGILNLYACIAFIEPEDETCEGTVIKDFTEAANKIAYSCAESSVQTDWLDMSSAVLEDFLKVDYKDFRKYYVAELKNPYPAGMDPAVNPRVLETYILTAGKTGSALSDYKAERINNANLDSDFKYGTIYYLPDPSYVIGNPGGGVNDIFRITLTKAQKDNLRALNGKSVTLYAHFSYGPKHYMLGFTIYLGADQSVKFVEHNPKYWFDDINAGEFNTVRRNVPVPDFWINPNDGDPSNNSDVTDYVKLLTDDWNGNVVKLQPAVAGVELEWSFVPKANQPSIKNPEGTNSNTWNVKNYKIADNKVSALFYPTHPNDTVVTLNPATGEIRYCHPLQSGIADSPTYISKLLLNMFAPDDKNVSKMLYCKVRLTAYSVDATTNCRIELGHEDINVRFLRPLTVKIADGASLRDAIPQGDDFPLGKLISARDWNASIFADGFPIFEYDAVNDVFKSCYYPVGATQANYAVEWYGYYGFKNLTVDVDNVYTDQMLTEEQIAAIDASNLDFASVKAQYPKFGLLTVINDQARVWVADAAARMTPIPATTALQITDVADLGKYIFVYANNLGVVHDFHLWVPITIEYAWGLYTDYVKVPVHKTEIVQN